MGRVCAAGLLVLAGAATAEVALVDVTSVATGVVVEARYFGSDNFVGSQVEGYEANKCLLTPPAAAAVAAAQAEVAAFGLTLVIYDCYRPQRAVNHFMRWAQDVDDIATRERYYPNVPKDQLVPEYIAERSGHSRGSTIDLTLAFAGGDALDMGTAWDLFDPLSHTENSALPPAARANRLLLRSVMARQGFRNYAAEWWHFTLEDEPNAELYLDLPVR